MWTFRVTCFAFDVNWNCSTATGAPLSAASAQAKFDVVKSLDTFDFLAIPSLNKSLVLDLARLRVHRTEGKHPRSGENSGTGKTHIALALGLAACQKWFPRPVHHRGVAGPRTGSKPRMNGA